MPAMICFILSLANYYLSFATHVIHVMHMKPKYLTFLTLLTCVTTGSCQIPRNDDIIRQKLNFETKNATADDYLLALGEKSNFNVIAETTELPTEANINLQSNDTLYALMFQFANAYQLGWHRLDEKTLILAPDAGIDEIARLLADGKGFPLGALIPDSDANLQAVLHYAQPLLEQKHKAGEKTDLTVAFADLPSPLNIHVVSWGISLGAGDGGLLFPIGVRHVLTDDYWQRVRIKKMPELQSANLFLTAEILTPKGVARSLWEIPGPVAEISLLRQQPPDLELPQLQPAQEKDFVPFWKPWRRAVWEKQLSNVALNSPCHLDGKRVSLQSVLDQVAQQCGVKLEVAKPYGEKLLTLRVRGLNARNILGALSRLTGGTWQDKGTEGYLLQGQASPLQRAVLPGDDFDRLRYRNRTDFYAENQAYRASIRDAIQREAGDLLNTPEGVAWVDLSEELRNELRAEIYAQLGNYVLRQQGAIHSILEGALRMTLDKPSDEELARLPVGPPNNQMKKGDPKLTLTLLKNDGSIIISQPIYRSLLQSAAAQKTASSGNPK
jgi:hypothetical protein